MKQKRGEKKEKMDENAEFSLVKKEEEKKEKMVI